jgi:hypothetical protein
MDKMRKLWVFGLQLGLSYLEGPVSAVQVRKGVEVPAYLKRTAPYSIACGQRRCYPEGLGPKTLTFGQYCAVELHSRLRSAN